MIVVVGQPLFLVADHGATVDGLPARIALAAAGGGRSVQLVGKAGEDPEGDAVVLALAKAGVGHVALLRDAGRPTARAAAPATDEPVTPGEAVDGPDAAHEATESSTWSTALDAADVDLALRYLINFAVLVVADPAEPDVVKVISEAATWVGARLVLVLSPAAAIPDGLPADAFVFEAPEADPDGVFASFVGSFAAALDGGEDPDEAFRSSIKVDGWAVSTGGGPRHV